MDTQELYSHIFLNTHLRDTHMLDTFIMKMTFLFAQVEGGYHAINPADADALSIGILQWHGYRAKKLLKRIVAKDEPNAAAILSKTYILCNLEYPDDFWDNRIAYSFEMEPLSLLLASTAGQAAQDELVLEDILNYLSHGAALGIADIHALAYFCDMENQGGPFAAERIISAAGGGAGMTLDDICRASLADAVLGVTRRNRRLYVYYKIQDIF